MEASSTSRRRNRLPDPDRPTTAPPAPTAISAQGDTGKIDLSDLEAPTVDHDALFSTSTDWNLLGKAMNVLKDQYEQCLQDIARLEALKVDALGNPERFIKKLSTVNIPTLQTIYRIPVMETEGFALRASRRGMNKKEQNVEFLLGRLTELQQRGSVVLPIPKRSDMVTYSDLGSGDSKIKGLNTHREKYMTILDNEPIIPPPRSVSVTPTLTTLTTSSNTATPPTRKRSRQSSNQTHNLPWTKEEKQRLNDFLLEYPEEPVAARRYAKIAAALGTRTPTQVFTRVTKLIASKKAHLDSDYDDDLSLDDQKQQAEYLKLKQALEQELSGTGTAQVHCGIHCGDCRAHPIVGIRYRCNECAVDLCDGCFVPGEIGKHAGHPVQTVHLEPIIDASMAEFDYLNH